MKKMIFGMLLSIIGLILSGFCFIFATMNPHIYNNIDGLMGSLLGAHLLAPFIIGNLILLSGLIITWYEAYLRK